MKILTRHSVRFALIAILWVVVTAALVPFGQAVALATWPLLVGYLLAAALQSVPPVQGNLATAARAGARDAGMLIASPIRGLVRQARHPR